MMTSYPAFSNCRAVSGNQLLRRVARQPVVRTAIFSDTVSDFTLFGDKAGENLGAAGAGAGGAGVFMVAFNGYPMYVISYEEAEILCHCLVGCQVFGGPIRQI